MIQYRSGLWAAGGFVAAVWVAIFWPLPPEALDLWLPCVLYADTAVIGLMFVAGILFVERRQGVLEALAVTPVSARVWLISKIVSLTLLATAVACSIAAGLYGLRAPWVRLIPSFVLASAVFTMLGFLVAAWFRNISNFLAASALFSLPTALPPLEYFEIWSHPGFWLLPFHPVLVAFEESFQPSASPRWIWALAALVGWLLLGLRACETTFHRTIAHRPGVPT